jgi:hypothetical protein
VAEPPTVDEQRLAGDEPALVGDEKRERAEQAPEPTMGIAIAWREGDNLPTLARLRELAADVASRGAAGSNDGSVVIRNG